LSNQEGYFLYRLAGRLPKEAVIVEIGSWKGRSTVWLAGGIKNNPRTRVFSIDPHYGEQKNNSKRANTFSELKANISQAGLQNNVNVIRKTSEQANVDFDKRIDLLFIDGAHEYEAVKQDYDIWSKKLNRNAWVVFHDATTLPGPWKVSRNNLLMSSRFENTGMLGSLVYGQYADPERIGRKAENLLRNLSICLFTSLYARIRKMRFPKNWRAKIRKINFKCRIARLKNV